jgi:hypothetical protein
MKASSPLLLFSSILCLFALVNCGGGGGNPEPVADQQFTKLQKTWVISSVDLGGTDRTAEYQAGVSGDTGPMKLTIQGTKGTSSTYTYAITGRPALSPWPKSGKWEFATNPSTQIVRDKGTGDELAITYTVDATNLQITFSYSGNGYTNPRVSQVAGSWTFKFTAQ